MTLLLGGKLPTGSKLSVGRETMQEVYSELGDLVVIRGHRSQIREIDPERLEAIQKVLDEMGTETSGERSFRREPIATPIIETAKRNGWAREVQERRDTPSIRIGNTKTNRTKKNCRSFGNFSDNPVIRTIRVRSINDQPKDITVAYAPARLLLDVDLTAPADPTIGLQRNREGIIEMGRPPREIAHDYRVGRNTIVLTNHTLFSKDETPVCVRDQYFLKRNARLRYQ